MANKKFSAIGGFSVSNETVIDVIDDNGNWVGNIVTVTKGGLGSSSLTANAVILGNGTGTVQTVSPGNVGNVLTSNGTTWVSVKQPLVEDPAGTYTLTGNLIVTSDTTVQGTLYETSDIKLKKNVETIKDALSTLNQLRGVVFNWVKNDKESMGLIAQETELIVPFIVQEDPTGAKSINYTALIGLIVESIKELNSKVESLENGLTELSNQLAVMKDNSSEVNNFSNSTQQNINVTSSVSTSETEPIKKSWWNKLKNKFF